MASVLLVMAVGTILLSWLWTEAQDPGSNVLQQDDLVTARRFWNCCRGRRWERQRISCVNNSCYAALDGLTTQGTCQMVFGANSDLASFDDVTIGQLSEGDFERRDGDADSSRGVVESTSKAAVAENDETRMSVLVARVPGSSLVSTSTAMPTTVTSPAPTVAVSGSSFSGVAAFLPEHVRRKLDRKFKGRVDPESAWFYGDSVSSAVPDVGGGLTSDKRRTRRRLVTTCNFTIPVALYRRCFAENYTFLCDDPTQHQEDPCSSEMGQKTEQSQAQGMRSTRGRLCPEEKDSKGNKTHPCAWQDARKGTWKSCLSNAISDMRLRLSQNMVSSASAAKELQDLSFSDEAKDMAASASILDFVEDLLARSQSQRQRLPPAENINFTSNVLGTLDRIAHNTRSFSWREDRNQSPESAYLPGPDVQRKKHGIASKIMRETERAAEQLSCSWASSSMDSANGTTENRTGVVIRKENIELKTYWFPFGDTEVCFPDCDDGAETAIKIEGGAVPLERLPQVCGDSAYVGFGTIFRNFGELLHPTTAVLPKSQQEPPGNFVVNSALVGFSFGRQNSSLLFDKKIVTATLFHSDGQLRGRVICAFWNFSRDNGTGGWDDGGCEVDYWASDFQKTTCRCNHLTNFAVLLDRTGQMEDSIPLKVLTIVCSVLSIIALMLTMTCLLCLRNLHCRRSTIACNTCFCLLVSNLIMIMGFEQTYSHSVACMVTRSILLCVLLSAFMWMLLEGYHLYRMLVVVFNNNRIPVSWFYVVGYGIPLAITTVATPLTSSNFRPNFCWFVGEDIFYFCGPMIVVISANSVLLVIALISASKVKIKAQQRSPDKIWSWLKGSASLMFLLGITWVLGLPLLAGNVIPYIGYVFTAVNGSQGVAMFAFHIACNDKARTTLIKMFKKKTRGTAFGKTGGGQDQRGKKAIMGGSIGSQSSTKSTQLNSTDSLEKPWAGPSGGPSFYL